MIANGRSDSVGANDDARRSPLPRSNCFLKRTLNGVCFLPQRTLPMRTLVGALPRPATTDAQGARQDSMSGGTAFPFPAGEGRSCTKSARPFPPTRCDTARSCGSFSGLIRTLRVPVSRARRASALVVSSDRYSPSRRQFIIKSRSDVPAPTCPPNPARRFLGFDFGVPPALLSGGWKTCDVFAGRSAWLRSWCSLPRSTPTTTIGYNRDDSADPGRELLRLPRPRQRRSQGRSAARSPRGRRRKRRHRAGQAGRERTGRRGSCPTTPNS